MGGFCAEAIFFGGVIGVADVVGSLPGIVEGAGDDAAVVVAEETGGAELAEAGGGALGVCVVMGVRGGVAAGGL